MGVTEVEEMVEDYLKQILDELRAIRRLLERGGASVHAQDNPTPERRAAPVAVVSQPSELSVRAAEDYLCRYLRGRDLTMTEADDLTPRNPTMRERMHLAYFIGQHYTEVRQMLGELRATLQRPRMVRVNVEGFHDTHLCVLTNIATRLHRLYMLESYEYARSRRQLVMKVRHQPYVHNYLSGGWFEWYVAQAVRKILGAAAPLVLRNVKLQTTSGNLCEVDVLFVVQRGDGFDIGVLECKSANAIHDDELAQVKRMASLLNRGIQRTAVVMPDAPSPAFVDRWSEQVGVQFIGRTGLEQFLQGMVKLPSPCINGGGN